MKITVIRLEAIKKKDITCVKQTLFMYLYLYLFLGSFFGILNSFLWCGSGRRYSGLAECVYQDAGDFEKRKWSKQIRMFLVLLLMSIGPQFVFSNHLAFLYNTIINKWKASSWTLGIQNLSSTFDQCTSSSMDHPTHRSSITYIFCVFQHL